MVKKYIFLFFVLLTAVFYIVSEKSFMIEFIDYKIYDIASSYLKKDLKNKKSNVVLINIDENSLKTLGQWPWPRVVLSNLLNIISKYYPASIGIDILFPEKDRTSPIELKKFYKKFFEINLNFSKIPFFLKDNDRLLAQSIVKNDVVLPVFMGKSNGFVYRGKFKFNPLFIKTSYKFNSVFTNLPSIQKAAKGFGFVNIFLDRDGILRRVPLFVKYKNSFIPFLPLGMVNLVDKMVFKDENVIEILGHKIKANENGEVLLNFSSPPSKIISVLDILRERFNPEDLTGKFVIIGSFAVGLNHSYFNSYYKNLSSLKINSIFIDNILNDAFFIQPEYLKKLNLFLAFFISFVMLLFLFNRWYMRLFLLFLLSFLISFVWFIYEFLNGVYVSIGYFWSPLFVYFFFLSLFFSLINHLEKRKFYKELEMSHNATLESIILVAAMKDDETGNHLIRTRKYVKVLATYLYEQKLYKDKLNQKFINMLYRAAPLHDIGKVGIPDNILKKNGRLTKEEYEIMKKHTILGKEMIESAMKIYNKNEFLQIACSIAYHHHEKWDGSGYPQGLKGDEIPIEGQLMAIADVYDALISKRAYKEAYSYQMTENLIIEQSGKAFNPVLVEAFKVLRYEFRNIAELHKERETKKVAIKVF